MLQAGWISTLLPISENWIAVRAPTLQSRPILTSAPITAPAPITVPAPISTLGPITASGSTITTVFEVGGQIDDRRRRDAVIVEPGLRAKRIGVPFARQLDEGAERLGGPQHRDMGGHLGLERGLTRIAPAFVAWSWSTYLRYRNARCMGPASSSEARPLITWPPQRIDQYRSHQRRQFGQRRGSRLLEEYRLRHSTRRSPAGLTSSAARLPRTGRTPTTSAATRSRRSRP